MQDSIFIKNLLGERTKRYPIWIMRQAGRYLPEYRQIRQTVPDFMSLCKNPNLAAEITLQPLQRFKLDAAINFSDILTIPDAMQLGLKFIPGTGPVFSNPIQNLSQIEKLSYDVTSDLEYVFNAIKTVKKELHNTPLIGFSGSPWTLAAYMVDGRGSIDFTKTCTMAKQSPEAMHKLLECLTHNVTKYCQLQIDAGANAIMLFDSHGNKLFGSDYQNLSLNYLSKIIQNLKLSHPTIPTIVYGKTDSARTIQLATTNATAVGVSHLASLSHVRQAIDSKIVLQGNINPGLMSSGSQNDIIKATKECIDAHNNLPGVINLGHGIKPDAKISNVELLIETIHNYI